MIVGSIIQPLPTTLVAGASYPVIFEFRNTSKVDFDNLHIDKKYPASFIETYNTCGTSLATNSRCEVTGIFTAKKPGQYSIALNMLHNGVTITTQLTKGNVTPKVDHFVNRTTGK